ncbi:MULTISPECIES: B3/4 domain-containing protein [unclassified Enterobacter]|jgi:DNA/RNA-binding domain of Phe-tRNA-synthetase-like protein|uniref:B3/B4 domain-containing protein n=1 Tax=unclassified Enterobacter TaxID=2608935 RepID=UPI0015C79CB2|nr:MULTISPECIES: B3/4 domain-containing protein [unclassified Enterobacter]MBB3307315.1 DNA/RNA-binding domain of Phe-tRNA-synthetase-like protein [Enterobacter sp. Sphag1F]NYI16080.1 DNA/RNA-binding domain of Phe-tRNA-synthetase-like protein [Enterobacter sp. Sphag71]
MFAFSPSIDPSVSALAPDFTALSILVQAAPVERPHVGEEALAQACRDMLQDDFPWAEAHLMQWAEMFKRFGAKPKRTPCSADALRKRVQRDGNMAAIDPIVDLYNAVSIRFAIPVGGENVAAYVGNPRLTRADGSEPFDVYKEGVLSHESPEPGEVVWRDDAGVTCRRWNWRQGVRTRLSIEQAQMWFVLERLPAMPLESLQQAGDMLEHGILQIMPGATVERRLLGNINS